MKKFTVKEIEEKFNDSFENAMTDFVESCLRQGFYEVEPCVRYFMNENQLLESEYDLVKKTYCEILDSYN